MTPTQPAEAGSVKRYVLTYFDYEGYHALYDGDGAFPEKDKNEVTVVLASDHDAVVAERDAKHATLIFLQDHSAKLDEMRLRAEAEREAALARVKHLEADFLELGKLSDQQTERIAELERDAARYRQLRDHPNIARGPYVTADDDGNTWLYGSALDETVDLAIREETP